MNNQTEDDLARAVAYGGLWAVLAGAIMFVASRVAPSFSQLPRHVQDRFRDTNADIEIMRRAVMHDIVLGGLFLIAGVFMAWLIQRLTTKRLLNDMKPNKPSEATR